MQGSDTPLHFYVTPSSYRLTHIITFAVLWLVTSSRRQLLPCRCLVVLHEETYTHTTRIALLSHI
jgi:hypothetical protein